MTTQILSSIPLLNSTTKTIQTRINNQVLLVCPSYNNEATLPELLIQLNAYVDKKDIVFILDGSTDGSKKLLSEHSYTSISFEKNLGKGAGLQAGIDFALFNGYTHVISIDADLQHDASTIPDFIKLARHFPECILIARRKFSFGKMPVLRVFSNTLSSIIVSVLSGQTIRDSQSGFRCIPVIKVPKAIKSTGFGFESELLVKASWEGTRIISIPTETIYNGSKSSFKYMKDTLKFIRLFAILTMKKIRRAFK